MSKESTSTTSVKFPINLLGKIYLLAEDLITNKSQVIIRGAEWITEFDSSSLNSISEVSKEVQLSEAEFIKCAVLKMLAEHNAYKEVYESTMPLVMNYIKGDCSVSYQYFMEHSLKNLENEVLKTIIKDEKYGHELDDIQKRIAIKYRIGKTWLESEEYKREREIHAEIDRLTQGYEDEPELSQEELEKLFKDKE